MESKELQKKIDIENVTCYYFDNIITDRVIHFNNILIDEKSYKNNYERILIYNISYKTLIDV